MWLSKVSPAKHTAQSMPAQRLGKVVDEHSVSCLRLPQGRALQTQQHAATETLSSAIKDLRQRVKTIAVLLYQTNGTIRWSRSGRTG